MKPSGGTAFPKPKDVKRPRKKRNHSRRNKTRARAKMIREMDLWSRAEVFERDGHTCIRCGNKGRQVQWAHVLSRRHLCLRWVADNAMSLCAGCHLFWHHEPAMAVEWFINNFSERWARIKAVLLASPKVDVKTLYGERISGSD